MKKAARKPDRTGVLLQDGFQNTIYGMLLFWALMPLALLLIEALLLRRTDKMAGYTTAEDVNSVCSAYAKYFYILGVATLCAAVYGLPRLLPDRTELRTAVRRRPWAACLAFMLLWSVLSTLFSANPFNRFWGLRYHNDGLGSYFIYAAVYVAALLLARSDRRMDLLRLFPFMGILCSVMAFWQFRVTTGNPILQLNSATAMFFNINHCAYFLTMSILCTAGLLLYDPAVGWRLFYPLAYAVQIFALLINNTMGCVLAVLLALPLLCVFWFRSGRREPLPPLTIVLIFLLLFVGSMTGILPTASSGGLSDSAGTMLNDVTTLIENPSAAMGGGSGRIRLWVGAIEQTIRHPIFGLGPDAPDLPTPSSNIIRAHNEFLQHAMFLGFPGLAAYLGAIITLLAHQWKHLREAEPSTLIAGGAAAGYLFSSFFGITMFYTAPFFFLLLGLASHSDSGGEQKLPSRSAGQEALARIAVLLVIFVYGILTAVLYRENRREVTDMNNWELAVTVGVSAYESGVDLNERFWFDPAHKTLISTASPPPAPYGQGTILSGKTCMTSTASEAGYNMEKDFTRYVILIRAEPLGENAVNGAGESAESTENTERTGSTGSAESDRPPVRAGVDFQVKTEWVYIPA